MNWLSRMNDAIDYLESHLQEEIDYARAARIACCSLSRFQRLFEFAADTTLSEYVRSRRMALSAEEMVNSGIKVIDLALKYGYESPEAFTRAFQAFHGISPTGIRKLGIYSDYPRISFQIKINGGHFNMGTKPLVRIEEHMEERVVSFRAEGQDPELAAWTKMRDWATANLSDYSMRRYIGCAPKGHHPGGEAHQADEGPGCHEYLAQMILYGREGDEGRFLGADVVDGPSGLYLVGDVVLNEFNSDGSIDIGESMQKSGSVMFECLKEIGGYELQLPERPYYEEHLFTRDWDLRDGALAGFKLWLPIRKIDQRAGG